MTPAALLPIAVATIAAFMAGGLWYGPLFGKVWQAEQRLTGADKARASMVRLFAATLVCEAIMATGLRAMPLVGHDVRFTMAVALGMAVLFVIPAMVVNHSYGLKSARLMAIDAGHWLLVFAVMGLVFGLLGD